MSPPAILLAFYLPTMAVPARACDEPLRPRPATDAALTRYLQAMDDYIVFLKQATETGSPAERLAAMRAYNDAWKELPAQADDSTASAQ